MKCSIDPTLVCLLCIKRQSRECTHQKHATFGAIQDVPTLLLPTLLYAQHPEEVCPLTFMPIVQPVFLFIDPMAWSWLLGPTVCTRGVQKEWGVPRQIHPSL